MANRSVPAATDVSPAVAATVDRINSNPLLSALYEKCAQLTDAELAEVQAFAAFMKQRRGAEVPRG